MCGPAVDAAEFVLSRARVVDADEATSSSNGLWQAVPFSVIEPHADEALRSLFPPERFIEQATYRAKLDEQELDLDGSGAGSDQRVALQGRFTWNVGASAKTRGTVPLTCRDVAFWGVETGGASAGFGLQGADRLALSVENGSEPFSGQWAIQGVRRTGGVLFQCQLPPALVTTVELSLPDSYRVDAPDHPVTASASSNGRTTWRVQPGRIGNVAFSIRQAVRRDVRFDLAFARQVAVEISEDETSWRSKLSVHRVGFRPRTITLALPENLQVSQCRVDGIGRTDIAPSVIFGQSVIQIPIPDEDVFTCELAGLLPRSRSSVVIPQVRIPGAKLLDGQATVSIRPPLLLQRIDAVGYRQTAGDLDAVSGDQLEFEQVVDAARLSVSVTPPEPELAVTSLHALDLTRHIPQLVVSTRVESLAGGTFTITFPWSYDWSITDIRTVGELPIASWARAVGNGGRPEVVVELGRPVIPGQSIELQITARLSQLATDVDAVLKPLRVQGGTTLDSALLVYESSSRAASPYVVDTEQLDPFPTAAPLPIEAADVRNGLGSPPSRYQFSDSEDVLHVRGMAAPSNAIADGSESLSQPTAEGSSIANRAAVGRSGLLMAAAEVRVLTEPEPRLRCQVTYRSLSDAEGEPWPLVMPHDAEDVRVSSMGKPLPHVVEDGAVNFPAAIRVSEWTVAYSLARDSIGVRRTLSAGLPSFEKVGSDREPTDAAVGNDVPSVSPVVGGTITVRCPETHLFVRANNYTFDLDGLSTWRTRLFGPLARPAFRASFLPWRFAHWKGDLGTQAVEGEEPARGATSLTLDWPDAVEFTVVNTVASRQVGWIAWFAGLAATVLVRLSKPANRRRWLAGAVASTTVATCVVPWGVCTATGGLLCGILFGCLVPRRLLVRFDSTPKPVDSSASTHVVPAATATLTMFALWLSPMRATSDEAELDPQLLIPSAALESGFRDALVVYVKADVAQRLSAVDSATQAKIESVEFRASRAPTGFVVDAVYTVSAPAQTLGVWIPIRSGISVDPASVMVDGVAVTPLPSNRRLYIPLADSGALRRQVTLRLFLTTESVDAATAYSVQLPFDRIANAVATLDDDVGITDGIPVPSASEKTIRLLPGRNVRLTAAGLSGQTATTTGPPTVPQNDAVTLSGPTSIDGAYSVIPEPMFDRVDCAVTLQRIFEPARVRVNLPAGWWLVSPAVIDSSRNEGQRSNDGTIISDAMPEGDRQSIQIDIVDPPSTGALTLTLGVRRDKRQRADEAQEQLPTIEWDDAPVDVQWSRQGDAELATSYRSSAIRSESTSRGVLTDAELDWTNVSRVSVSGPIFDLPIVFPKLASVVDVSVTQQGKQLSPRVAVDSGRLDLLFDGAVTGVLDIELTLSLDRPRRGLLNLPRVAYPGVASANAGETLSLTNESYSQVSYRDERGEAALLWEDTAVFEEWPRKGPRALSVYRSGSRPRLDSAVVLDADDDGTLLLRLAANAGVARRTVYLAGQNEIRPAGTSDDLLEPVVLTTKPGEPTLVSVPFESNETLTDSPRRSISHPFAGQTDVVPMWIVVDGSSIVEPVGVEERANSEMPPWLVARLEPDREYRVYRAIEADQSVELTRPIATRAIISSVAHMVERDPNTLAVRGTSIVVLAEPGGVLFEIDDSVRLQDVFVDGRRVSPELGENWSGAETVIMRWLVDGQESEVRPPRVTNAADIPEQVFVLDSRLSRASGLSVGGDIQDGEFTSAITAAFGGGFPIAELPGLDTERDDSVPVARNVTVETLRRFGEPLADARVTVPTVPVTSSFARQLRSNLVAAVLIAIAMACVVIGVHLTTGWTLVADRISQHPEIATASFGLVWWLFLTPSVLGLILIAAVLVRALRSSSRRVV